MSNVTHANTYSPLLIAALALALGACASLDTTPGSTVPAGLAMEVQADDPATQLWRADNAALPQRYYLAPVTWELPPAQRRLVGDEDRSMLESGLTDSFATSLSGLERVAAPAPGAVTVRATITGVDRSSPAANAVLSLLVGPVDTGGAAVSVLIEDGASGRPLAALATSRNGRLMSTKGFSRWGHAQQAFAYTATQVAPLFAAREVRDAR